MFQPVYFSDGKPVACTHTIESNVPENAVFTDTTYNDGTGIDITGTAANSYIIHNTGILDASTGDSSGAISVAYYDTKNGITKHKTVPVNGLKSAAFTDSSDYIPRSLMGIKGGVATLDASTGLIPSSQLPSYIDDVVEGYYVSYGDSSTAFLWQKPAVKTKPTDTELKTAMFGEAGKIYVDLYTNNTYRWSGSKYIEISKTEIPAASVSILGGIYATTTDKVDNTNRQYWVDVTPSGKAWVDVPWTDDSVTSAKYHYSPVEDTSSRISVTASKSNGQVTITDSSLQVLTSVYINRDSKGHITGATGAWSNITAEDKHVTDEKYHYTPTGVDASALSVDAANGTATNITGTGGKLNVVTGVNIKRDTKGHITGLSVDSKNIYSTDYNTDHIHGYCDTAGETAKKIVSYTGYTLKQYNYFILTLVYSNTAKSTLTLNVNNTGEHSLYINGVISNSSHYSLPSGTYIVYYDGEYYYVHTDETIPGIIEEAKVAQKAVFDASAQEILYYLYDASVNGCNITFRRGNGERLTITTQDTNRTSKNVVTDSSISSKNGKVDTSTGVYLNHLEDTTVTSSHKIVGLGNTRVTSDASGNISIGLVWH